MWRSRVGVSASTGLLRKQLLPRVNLFCYGQVISLTGTWMQDAALPWLVLQQTHSGFDVGLLTFCRFLPVVGGVGTGRRAVVVALLGNGVAGASRVRLQT